MSLTIRILGLDPGLAQMGWGVIDVSGSRLAHVAHGVIATRTASGLGVRLMTLHRELAVVIQAHAPAATRAYAWFLLSSSVSERDSALSK